MNRVVLVMVGLLGLLALARPAQAGDIEIENPERAPFIPRRSSIWAGYYFGIYAGGALGRSNHDFPPATGNFTISGLLIGGTIGLNFQAGRGVAGIELDAGWANIKGSTINNCPGLSCETNSSGLITLRGRLGYAFERFLPFVTGGVALGEIYPNVVGIGTGSAYKPGLTLGAGVDFALTYNWIARLEYLYVDLGTYACGACGIALADNVSFRANIVRSGLTYKFDD